jgi:hypothetical protein
VVSKSDGFAEQTAGVISSTGLFAYRPNAGYLDMHLSAPAAVVSGCLLAIATGDTRPDQSSPSWIAARPDEGGVGGGPQAQKIE